jgi:hypothetical protein
VTERGGDGEAVRAEGGRADAGEEDADAEGWGGEAGAGDEARRRASTRGRTRAKKSLSAVPRGMGSTPASQRDDEGSSRRDEADAADPKEEPSGRRGMGTGEGARIRGATGPAPPARPPRVTYAGGDRLPAAAPGGESFPPALLDARRRRWAAAAAEEMTSSRVGVHEVLLRVPSTCEADAAPDVEGRAKEDGAETAARAGGEVGAVAMGIRYAGCILTSGGDTRATGAGDGARGGRGEEARAAIDAAADDDGGNGAVE